MGGVMDRQKRTMTKKLGPIGRTLRMVGVIRCYHDGDGAGFVWRWWNPLVWVIAPLAFLWCCALAGIPEAWRYRHEAGFGVKPWFLERPKRLEWE